MNVIVTGANGFIGSALMNELNVNSNFNVSYVTDLITPSERSELLSKKVYSQFVSPQDLVEKHLPSLKSGELQWIFHLGAISTTTETSWKRLETLNLEYTKSIFKWCTKNNCNLVYASSAATYGAGEQGYSDSTLPQYLLPLNLYGKSKNDFDLWALEQTETPQKWFGLKFFNVFGPNENFKNEMSSLVFKAHSQIRTTQKMKLFKSAHPDYADGEQMRDFVYVKDVTRWILELTRASAKSGIYNMGFGKARTWKDLVTACFTSLALKNNIEFIDMPDSIKNQYQYFTEAEMKKWQSAGLSQPQWPLERAVQDYYQNYLNPGLFL